MATSLKFSSHARSISFPSSSHPLYVSAEEHLQRLKSSEGASSSAHASACQKLDVLQLPLNQHVLSQERSGKWEEEVLDGSLQLLDICGEVRDVYSQMKESVQELESSLRRKRGGELADELSTCMISKKNLSKMIYKCFKELRGEKTCNLPLENKDSDTVTLINLIKEVQIVSVTVLESALSYLCGAKSGSQPRSLSLVSKLFQHKRASSEGDSEVSAIEKVEKDLNIFLSNKKSNKGGDLQMQDVLKGLEAVDSSIQELAEMLENVFRLLLKTRVSFLNIRNH